jgi:hypothetical protein
MGLASLGLTAVTVLSLSAGFGGGGLGGAQRFRGSASTRIVEADGGHEVEALDETTSVTVSAAGDIHASYRNSLALGRELVFVAAAGPKGTVWIRPGYGKFVKRPPADPGEPRRVAAEIAGTLAADLELLGTWAARSDAGAVTLSARPAHRTRLSLAPSGRSGGRDPDGWRSTVVGEAVDGELVVDDATGALLHGSLRARLRFVRGGKGYQMTLTAEHAVADIGTALTVAPPGDAQVMMTP